MSRRKKAILASALALLLIVLALVLLYFLLPREDTGEGRIPLRQTAELDIYVWNQSCQSDDFCWVVEDPAVAGKILSLCSSAQPLRPYVSVDLIAGGQPAPQVCLAGQGSFYRLSFGLMQIVEEQLDLSYPYRAEPVVFIEKWSWEETENWLQETEGWAIQWRWHSTMPAADYASLYLLLEGYSSETEVARDQVLGPLTQTSLYDEKY